MRKRRFPTWLKAFLPFLQMTSFLAGTKSIDRSRCSSEAGGGSAKDIAKEVGIVMMNRGTLVDSVRGDCESHRVRREIYERTCTITERQRCCKGGVCSLRAVLFNV